MKFRQKYIYHIICTFLFVLVAAVGFAAVYSKPEVYLYFESDNGVEEISIYEAEEGCKYVFLPAFASVDDIKFHVPRFSEVMLDGLPLNSGDSCGDIILKQEYKLSIDGDDATLVFHQSANTATLFIDTETGSMERIHQNKDVEENAEISLYSKDGILEFAVVNGVIKGRGNTSWEGPPKKPYLLTLPQEEAMLGMPASTKWVLISNYEDESNIRNKIIFDTANRVAPGIAPESRYVDLYLNGEYAGLYLLTEKIDLVSKLPDIDVNNGEFLCTIEIASRVAGLDNAFKTNSGRAVEITESARLSQSEISRIQTLVNGMETAIMSEDDSAILGVIDLDSWVRRYLIDEIFANADADKASSYFYYSDGIFYAGPIWDYDLSFGDYLNNGTFFSYPVRFIGRHWPYNNALNNNKLFAERLTEIYSTEFLPIISELISHGIADQYAAIEDAVKMNELRWAFAYNTSEDNIFSVSEMCDYLEARTQFLNSAWIDGKEYCAVDFYYPWGGYLLFISQEKGTQVDLSILNTEYTTWIDEATGEVFDFSQPVLQNMSFRAVDTSTPDDSAAEVAETPESESSGGISISLPSRKVVVAFSAALFLLAFLLLLFADIRRTYERKR